MVSGKDDVVAVESDMHDTVYYSLLKGKCHPDMAMCDGM